MKDWEGCGGETSEIGRERNVKRVEERGWNQNHRLHPVQEDSHVTL